MKLDIKYSFGISMVWAAAIAGIAISVTARADTLNNELIDRISNFILLSSLDPADSSGRKEYNSLDDQSPRHPYG
jgi:hypothetical protein